MIFLDLHPDLPNFFDLFSSWRPAAVQNTNGPREKSVTDYFGFVALTVMLAIP